MQFAYQARDASGRIRTGTVTAESGEQATQQLRQEALYLLSLEEAGKAAQRAQLTLFQRRITKNELIYFTNQLAVMVDAGVPLATALESILKQVENPTFQSLLTSVHRSVEAGEDFSAVLARHPKYFDRTYVNLVKASEASGTLALMLDRIATQSRAELEMMQKVRGALAYPAAMLAMCLGVSTFLLTYVFPKLSPMFASRNMELPGPTKLMLTLSGALTNQWYWFVIGAAALIGGFLYVRQQPWGRAGLDWLRLHAPLIGTLSRKVAISRSLRTLATSVSAGVPMLEALKLCGGVANNVFYERSWMHVSDEVTTGRQIHESLAGNELFPATLLQMIAAGESTGKLGPVLNKASDYYDREVDTTVRTTTSLIEPIMVAVMGGVIGLIALAMLLPVFKLSSHVS